MASLSAAAQTNPANPAQLDRVTAQKKAAQERAAALEAERAAAREEIGRLQGALVTKAAQAETYEQAARDISQRLAELTAQETRLDAEIFARRDALADLLAALQRIERNPPPALAVNPPDAKAAAQAARLLGALTEDLKTQADLLRERLSNLQFVRSAIEREREDLRATELDLSRERKAIQALVTERKSAEMQLGEQSALAQKEADKLAAEAEDLRALIAKLEAIARDAAPRIKPGTLPPPSPLNSGQIPVPRLKPRPDMPPEPLALPPDTLRFADARGQLRSPARGAVLTGYSSKSKGITLQTLPGAQVISPYTGRIEFVGPFKNYDRVVILNVGDGYFIVLTGLAQTYGAKGQTVLSGEPLGVMPGASQTSAKSRPELYIEFRKDGLAIDPHPWLGTGFARAG